MKLSRDQNLECLPYMPCQGVELNSDAGGERWKGSDQFDILG